MTAHDYLSTGCLHGDMLLPDGRTGHDYCQSDMGAAGAKKPAQCKFCQAPCSCECHEEPLLGDARRLAQQARRQLGPVQMVAARLRALHEGRQQ
ncbi:hypothetical protein OG455_41665 [Kitasatospora sp. NBC_01287]|uniref:hypothetical protein n=1 Tax=Kitasatospora sp. NBC_01287 TaxID=2903573 RepID=UPI0022547D39|nr:hypothetical protein [Kitasatospora sp. NBC_01287]MCX4751756.1 hypothetical protein [Kitasatospora sp. NBC_01287]MCX4751952.1 hypothetical protein [Kitasatospora sp. NBC_01287]